MRSNPNIANQLTILAATPLDAASVSTRRERSNSSDEGLDCWRLCQIAKEKYSIR